MRVLVPLLVLPLLVLPLLGGCLAKAAVDVVTLPVKVVGQVVETGWDAATTTQQEADEDRGRALRLEEERLEKERRRAERDRLRAEREAARRGRD
jgi:hypothetical protein